MIKLKPKQSRYLSTLPSTNGEQKVDLKLASGEILTDITVLSLTDAITEHEGEVISVKYRNK